MLVWDKGKRRSHRCAVTGCAISVVLRSSHIKPWADSTNSERLNPANGLLLAAHIDALFDGGLISFENNGTMLASGRVLPKSVSVFDCRCHCEASSHAQKDFSLTIIVDIDSW